MEDIKMANFLDEQIEVPRRTMVVFFIVDTSGSMQGAKIGAVNSAIEEVLPEIAKISDENADAEIKIAVLDFSTDAKWLTPKPIDASNYVLNAIILLAIQNVFVATADIMYGMMWMLPLCSVFLFLEKIFIIIRISLMH